MKPRPNVIDVKSNMGGKIKKIGLICATALLGMINCTQSVKKRVKASKI